MYPLPRETNPPMSCACSSRTGRPRLHGYLSLKRLKELGAHGARTPCVRTTGSWSKLSSARFPVYSTDQCAWAGSSGHPQGGATDQERVLSYSYKYYNSPSLSYSI